MELICNLADVKLTDDNLFKFDIFSGSIKVFKIGIFNFLLL